MPIAARVLLVLLVALFAVPAPAQVDRPAAKVNLRPVWKKGQEVRFRVQLDSSLSDSAAQDQNQSTRQDIGILLRCNDVNPEAGPSLELVYESLRITGKSPVGNINFDSTKPAKPDDPFDAILRSIVGLTLPVAMDKDGNITSVGGAESGLGGALAGQFSGADTIKGLFGPIFSTKKTSGEAAVGESWTNDDTIQGSAGAMRLVTTNTLESHANGKAVISMKGKVTLAPSSGGSGGGAAPQASIRNSDISGRAVWDTEAGMLSSIDSRQRIEVQTQADGKTSTSMQDMTLKVTRLSR